MQKIDAILILGCYGYTEDGFVFCNGVSNPVLELQDLSDIDYPKVELFLDKTCRLFDCVVDDNNKCSNILNMLFKTFKVIDESVLFKIQHYLLRHKGCRLYLSLVLRENLCQIN